MGCVENWEVSTLVVTGSASGPAPLEDVGVQRLKSNRMTLCTSISGFNFRSGWNRTTSEVDESDHTAENDFYANSTGQYYKRTGS